MTAFARLGWIACVLIASACARRGGSGGVSDGDGIPTAGRASDAARKTRCRAHCERSTGCDDLDECVDWCVGELALVGDGCADCLILDQQPDTCKPFVRRVSEPACAQTCLNDPRTDSLRIDREAHCRAVCFDVAECDDPETCVTRCIGYLSLVSDLCANCLTSDQHIYGCDPYIGRVFDAQCEPFCAGQPRPGVTQADRRARCAAHCANTSSCDDPEGCIDACLSETALSSDLCMTCRLNDETLDGCDPYVRSASDSACAAFCL